MAGLRMPAPVPVTIPQRRKLSLRDEHHILMQWSAVQFASMQQAVSMTMTERVERMRLAVRCAGCSKICSRAEYQYDHEIARAISGDDSVENLRPYCVTVERAGMVSVGCHNLKTARDQAIIAKGKRIRGEKGRRNPNRKPRPRIKQRKDPWPKGKRKIASRPFPKSNRRKP